MKQNHFLTIPDFHLPTVTIEALELLIKTTKQYNVERVRFTPGNQIAFSGINKADLREIAGLLKTCMKPLPRNTITAILSCPGCGGCRHGMGNTSSMSEHIAGLELPSPMPAKIKVAVAGCKRCCTMPFVRDVGLAATDSGWRLSFGGNGGSEPRIGDIIAENLSEFEAAEIVRFCLVFYQKYAQGKTRTSRFVEKFGADTFKKQILSKKMIT